MFQTRASERGKWSKREADEKMKRERGEIERDQHRVSRPINTSEKRHGNTATTQVGGRQTVVACLEPRKTGRHISTGLKNRNKSNNNVREEQKKKNYSQLQRNDIKRGEKPNSKKIHKFVAIFF